MLLPSYQVSPSGPTPLSSRLLYQSKACVVHRFELEFDAGGLGTNKDMGGLLQQIGRDLLIYQAGRLQLAVHSHSFPKFQASAVL